MSKGWMAGVMVALAASLAIPAQAAPFDEKLRAPRVTTPQALRAELKAHFETFERQRRDPDPAAFVRDRLAHRQWSDLYFSVKLALDEGKPLPDLAEFGLLPQPDGTHGVDLREFPQWEPLDSRLFILTNPEVFESSVPTLEARGFRASDLDALRIYLAAHDPRLATYAEGRQLVETFAKRLQAQRQARQALNLQEVLAFRYQKASIKAEAKRRWALGLLDTLDRQRQRILASFLEEFESDLTFGAASEPLATSLEQEAQPVVSGEYVQILATEEQRMRQDLARRAEKLTGGAAR